MYIWRVCRVGQNYTYIHTYTVYIRWISEVVDGAKVLKMFLFRCKSCLNNIPRCFMKFKAKWTTPVV